MNLEGLPPFRICRYDGNDGCCPGRLSKIFRPKRGRCRPKPLYTQEQLDNATEEQFIRMGRKMREQTRSEYYYINTSNRERRLVRKPLPHYHPNVWGIYRTQDKRPEKVPRRLLRPVNDISPDSSSDRSRPGLSTKDKTKALPEDGESLLYDQHVVRKERAPGRLPEGSLRVNIGTEGKLKVHNPVSVPENNGLLVEGSPCDPLDEKDAPGKSEEKMSNKKKRKSIVMSPARIPIKKKKYSLLSFDKKFDALVEGMIKNMATKKFNVVSEDKKVSAPFKKVFKRKMTTFKTEIKKMMKSYITKRRNRRPAFRRYRNNLA